MRSLRGVRSSMPPQILTVVVTPGTPCKIALPPCSALEIKQAALAGNEPLPAERCVLECDLASHSFLLCSIVPNGPHQAALGTVITNDPAEPAWVFLKARGPCAFHVIGQLVVDKTRAEASPADFVVPAGYQRVTREALLREDAVRPELDLSDSGWDLGAPVVSGDTTGGRFDAAADERFNDVDLETDGIEVLLPDGDDGDVRGPRPPIAHPALRPLRPSREVEQPSHPTLALPQLFPSPTLTLSQALTLTRWSRSRTPTRTLLCSGCTPRRSDVGGALPGAERLARPSALGPRSSELPGRKQPHQATRTRPPAPAPAVNHCRERTPAVARMARRQGRAASTAPARKKKKQDADPAADGAGGADGVDADAKTGGGRAARKRCCPAPAPCSMPTRPARARALR